MANVLKTEKQIAVNSAYVEGEVKVFDLSDHPDASLSSHGHTITRAATTPENAVRAAIVAQHGHG